MADPEPIPVVATHDLHQRSTTVPAGTTSLLLNISPVFLHRTLHLP